MKERPKTTSSRVRSEIPWLDKHMQPQRLARLMPPALGNGKEAAAHAGDFVGTIFKPIEEQSPVKPQDKDQTNHGHHHHNLTQTCCMSFWLLAETSRNDIILTPTALLSICQVFSSKMGINGTTTPQLMQDSAS